LKLGEWFESGHGVPQDRVEAYKWFDLLGARYNYFELYRSTENDQLLEAARGKRDALSKRMTPAEISEGLERAVMYLHPEYERTLVDGSVEAQLDVAKHFLFGETVRLPGGELTYVKNYEAAGRWFARAASGDNADAQYQAGEFYLHSLKKPDIAARFFREAAAQGHTRGQFWLAIYYAANAGKSPDPVEAYKWFRIALAGAEGSGLRDEIESRLAREAEEMTPKQIALAEQFAREFVPQESRATSVKDKTGSDSERLKASGSGFFVSDDGGLISNCHVVEEASRVMVKTKRGIFPARIIKLDPANDIAVLRVSGSGFHSLPITQSASAKLGDSVFTIGFPNPALQGVEPKLTDGKVNSLTGMRDDARYFQISIAVQPGNSGGAVVSSVGNVVGIVTARLSDRAALESSGALPQNVNYAIKSSYVLSLLEAVPELTPRLKQQWPPKERKFEYVAKEAQEAAALVLAY